MIPIIVKLKLAAGWKGVALEQWSDFAFDPEKLTQKPDTIFKSENGNVTALKQIEIKGKKIFFVVKKNVRRTGIRALGDLLRAPKSLRNFYLAVILKQKNIEVAEPVAALWHRKYGSIYITEYIQNSLNLYDIAFGKDKEIIKNFSARKTVIRQVAQVLAKLNKSNFWHRDPKAGNFIIYKDGGIYRVKLIDLDGIKQDSAGRRENHIKTISKLAESLIRFKAVNFADLYRGFLIYCNTMGIDDTETRELFRKVAKITVAARLLTIISDSYKLKILIYLCVLCELCGKIK
ncbi:MAG: lipopolysaccharide kinase InaA family protein [Phycisphaerae bacterium]|jgi:tRNA A-37 threonylcarbamoyl transferase component Bud32